jgi:tetratricopeptide (TPR) repeat protein
MHLAQATTQKAASGNALANQQCLLAKQLENLGRYEEARQALSSFWRAIGTRPNLQNLDRATQAELLLRAGTLSGWIGSANQITNAQAFAKDLISEAIRGFKSLRDNDKLSEAQTDLAICYWREGAMDEARIVSKEALANASTPETITRTLINQALIEVAAGQLHETLRLLDQAGPLIENIEDHTTKGRYHTIRAVALKRTETPDNLDRALIEYTAASIHFEQAGHTAYFASGENNISSLLLEFRRYREAHQHLDNAYKAFARLRDKTKIAQTYETRARILIAQERYHDAEQTAFQAIRSLKDSNEPALLAEALTTRAIALARLRQYTKAFNLLHNAAALAASADDTQSVIRAKLTGIRELGTCLKPTELIELYIKLDEQIGKSKDISTINQLRDCATITINCLKPIDAIDTTSPTLGLKEKLLRYEASLIKDALEKTRGQITAAARLLGMTHQGLSEALEGRHKGLRPSEPVRRTRRRSIMRSKPTK